MHFDRFMRQVRAWVALVTAALGGCQSTEDPTALNGRPASAVGITVEELVAPGAWSYASDVNSSGEAVGTYDGGCGGRMPAFWDASGSFTALPLPAGFCGGSADAISESGYIAGTLVDGTTRQVARWIPGATGYAPEYIGVGPRGGTVEPHGIDDQGNLIGYEFGDGLPMAPVYWSSPSGWSQLRMATGSTSCTASALSRTGAVSGNCYFNSISSAVYWPGVLGDPVVLPRLAGQNSHHTARGINGAGTLVGTASNQARNTVSTVPVSWSLVGGNWQVASLTILGGPSEANDIDEAGNIVGYSTAKGGKQTAVVWLGGTSITSLPGLSSKGSGSALAVAPTGRIAVGQSVRGGNNRATRWWF